MHCSVLCSNPHPLAWASSSAGPECRLPGQTYHHTPPESQCSGADFGGHFRELFGVRRLRTGGKLEGVVLVAGDHVNVEVEDRLPGGRLAGIEQVHTVAAEPVAHLLGQVLRGRERVREIVVTDLVEVP